MKKKDIHTFTLEQLTEELTSLLKEQFNLRMQQANRALSKTHLLKIVRRDIARVKTFIKQKQVSVND